MTTLNAGDKTTITVAEGAALSVAGTTDAVGVVYRLDNALGGTNSVQSWAIGSGEHAPLGPYLGSSRFLVTCTRGSIVATVSDASLAVAQLAYDGSGTVIGIRAPDNSILALGGAAAAPGIFDVTNYGAVGGGIADDSAGVLLALLAIYANKGGKLVFPFKDGGYRLAQSIVIDVGQYVGGSGITVELNGNTLTPTHAGWCFDIKTNYFSANNGSILGKKPVYILGQGATVTTSNIAASGGFRFQDTVSTVLENVSINQYQAGDAVQLCITSNDLSTWVEHGRWENITGSYNLNGIYTKSSNPTGSFLGNVFTRCVFETKVNNGKCFNFEGLHFDCLYINLGGYYNQLGTTGGCGFYLNGGYTGSTFIGPWIDVGNTGTQSAATDIVFGPNYTLTTSYFPTLLNTLEINLPVSWRDKLFVAGPIGSGTLSTTAAANPREVLRDPRTYYVALSGGSDSANDGLSSGKPFATVQKALDVIYQTLDCGSKTVTVQLADGTYTAPVSVAGVPLGLGSASLILKGNTATPGNVILSTASDAFSGSNGAQVVLQGIQFQTTSGSGIKSDSGARVFIGAGCRFGACAGQHIFATAKSTVQITAGYAIVGNAPIHWNAAIDSTIMSFGNTIDATNRAFSNIFATATETSVIGVSGAFTTTGSTGTRYYITSGGTIQTYGAGATYLPGNANGYADAATFGQYL